MASMPGDFSETRPADEEIQKICDEVKPQVESKTGRNFDIFNALLYRKQIVNGNNFLIKVYVGGSYYIHIMVYQNLSGEKTVTGVQEGHSKDDPLIPF
ncbi:cystatin-A5-like [Halichoeres trimaculatus]|uniref:cystatin-A5-like n=1 Tax=Halichoeres trimaculatus TaxID=147232 RepID=UPI003D9F8326